MGLLPGYGQALGQSYVIGDLLGSGLYLEAVCLTEEAGSKYPSQNDNDEDDDDNLNKSEAF